MNILQKLQAFDQWKITPRPKYLKKRGWKNNDMIKQAKLLALENIHKDNGIQ